MGSALVGTIRPVNDMPSESDLGHAQAEHWEAEAANWIAWARTPGHDAYWDYSPRFFDEIVPSPGLRTLEIGCGEGRVTRDLLRRGHHMVAVDPTPSLVRAAREADRESKYVLADGAHLPFVDASFDIVVAYNSLMDVDDMHATVAEAARVLVPGGHLCVCITHPLNDSGTFEEREAEARFVIAGSYLDIHPFNATFERDGLTMTFRGFVYPVEAYSRAVEDARLLIEMIREPAQAEVAVAANPAERRWQRVPMFLFARAVKPTVGD